MVETSKIDLSAGIKFFPFQNPSFYMDEVSTTPPFREGLVPEQKVSDTIGRLTWACEAEDVAIRRPSPDHSLKRISAQALLPVPVWITASNPIIPQTVVSEIRSALEVKERTKKVIDLETNIVYLYAPLPRPEIRGLLG